MVEGVGKIPLADITLIEDPNEEDRTDSKLLIDFFPFVSVDRHLGLIPDQREDHMCAFST